MATSLSGKVALVTGSSRSIGAAIANRLADDGANVVVNYISNSEAASKLVHSINAKRAGAATAIQADVSTIAGGQSLLHDTVQAFGKIDIVILNAAIMGSKPLAEIDEQFFDDHMNANVKGQLFLVKAAAPLLTSGTPLYDFCDVYSDLKLLTHRFPNYILVFITYKTLLRLTQRTGLYRYQGRSRANFSCPRERLRRPGHHRQHHFSRANGHGSVPRGEV
jgi:NAD(P)-dependent dehydrogenase (short-subunit alcohol dehydrogenase family)